VVGERGEVWLKRHHHAGGWAREREAYRQLAPLQGELIPRMLACMAPPAATLVLSWIPGVPVPKLEATRSELETVHRHAGAARAQLDTVPCAADELTVDRAYAERFEHWHHRARQRVPESLRRTAAELFDASAFVGATRVACHRDFTPQNWLVEPTPTGPRLRVVDLGQARPDLALVDLVKLREDTWQRAPSLQQAFLDGWGHALDAGDRHRLDLLGLLHGLATASWAHAHADPSLFRHGLEVLERRVRVLTRPT
jgi:hypothetical protein